MFAAYGEIKRELALQVPSFFSELNNFIKLKLVLPGIIALQTNAFTTYNKAHEEMTGLDRQLQQHLPGLQPVAIIVVCDDSNFVAQALNNFIWVTFTRCNPSHDIYGVNSFYKNKHWGCNGSLIIDARIKPHHAPPVEKDEQTEKRIDRLFEKGGSLYKVIS